jgi:hypothetical protein
MSRFAVIVLTVLVALVPASAEAKTKHRHRPKPKPVPLKVSTTTPISVTLLPGSTMTFDRQDGSAPRVVALTGSAQGGIKGGYMLSKDNTVALRSASVALDPTSAGAAGLPPLTLALNPAMANRIEIARTGALTAALGVTFAGVTVVIRPAGQIVQGTGLSAVTVDSPPQWVSIGDIGAAVSTHLVARIAIG